MPLLATRRGMQLHAGTLLGVAVILAMSISLAWQTADWLRLLRAPAALDRPNAASLLPSTASQGLEHLFGSSQSSAAPAPATSMRLTLLGSFVNADPKRSSAIIRLDGNPAQRYNIDSEVIAGVSLHAVYADRVELLRNGRLESLAFPRNYSSDEDTAYAPDEAATDARDQLEQLEADNLTQLRERMDALRQQMEMSGTLPADAEPTDPPTESN
ncbi:Type II secretion system protein N [compost metagenome]